MEPTADSVLKDPAVHSWVKVAIREAMKRDPVDAAQGLELASFVVSAWCDSKLKKDCGLA